MQHSPESDIHHWRGLPSLPAPHPPAPPPRSCRSCSCCSCFPETQHSWNLPWLSHSLCVDNNWRYDLVEAAFIVKISLKVPNTQWLPAVWWLDAPTWTERGVGGRAAERGRGQLGGKSPVIGVCRRWYLDIVDIATDAATAVRPRHPSTVNRMKMNKPRLSESDPQACSLSQLLALSAKTLLEPQRSGDRWVQAVEAWPVPAWPSGHSQTWGESTGLWALYVHSPECRVIRAVDTLDTKFDWISSGKKVEVVPIAH